MKAFATVDVTRKRPTPEFASVVFFATRYFTFDGFKATAWTSVVFFATTLAVDMTQNISNFFLVVALKLIMDPNAAGIFFQKKLFFIFTIGWCVQKVHKLGKKNLRIFYSLFFFFLPPAIITFH